jgi:hypothetical protein
MDEGERGQESNANFPTIATPWPTGPIRSASAWMGWAVETQRESRRVEEGTFLKKQKYILLFPVGSHATHGQTAGGGRSLQCRKLYGRSLRVRGAGYSRKSDPFPGFESHLGRYAME